MVAASAYSVILGARDDQPNILLGGEVARNAGKETWPAGPAFELHLRGEKRQRATRADEHSRALFSVQRAREWPLRGFLAQHEKLLIGERRFPLGFGFLNRR